MRVSLSSIFVLVSVSFLLTPLARADEPKFEFGKAEDLKEVKGVEWKAQAKAGLIHTTGNSRVTTVSAAGDASRKEGDNKFAAEGGVAYARASIRVFNDADADGLVDMGEIGRAKATSARAFFAKARYDRFFTTHNSGFVTAKIEADTPAGKELIGGGQIGYSRQVYKDPCREVIAEIGYDLTYEDYVAKGDAVVIHSARGFLAYNSQIGPSTQFLSSTEALINLNEEETPSGDVSPGEDVRILGKAGLTTTLWKDISFGVTFTLKYDHAPAPLPPIGAAMFAPGFVPSSDELDTITEATLIVNFI